MKTLVIHSGGLDSTVLLYENISLQKEVISVSFDYQQRHKRELIAAEIICKNLQIEHYEIKIPDLFCNSSLTSDMLVPKGHYAHESMKKTVVPGRNMLFISMASALAAKLNCNNIAIGVHTGDHTIYPDCRPKFIFSMQDAIKEQSEGKLILLAPYLFLSKRDIVNLGRLLNVPFEDTWTCYEGGEVPCDECGSCFERKEAML